MASDLDFGAGLLPCQRGVVGKAADGLVDQRRRVQPPVGETTDQIDEGERAAEPGGRAGDLRGPVERVLRLLGVAEGVEHGGEMAPVVGVRRVVCELGAQQRQVAPVLVRLVAVVAEVVEPDRHFADREPVVDREPADRRRDLLVHRAGKADPGIRAPQPILPSRGHPSRRDEEQPQCELLGLLERFAQLAASPLSQPLVGVYVEDPPTACQVETDVARPREVAAPAILRDAGAVGTGDLARRVD